MPTLVTIDAVYSTGLLARRSRGGHILSDTDRAPAAVDTAELNLVATATEGNAQ
ncbi:hypothetical protein [Streptomyces sp. NPDC088847]|uniref:hypothetical protein n=1 Tax=Streptomyces sp. NPDC088847 TaxID=3365909 RepID=UPI00382E6702